MLRLGPFIISRSESLTRFKTTAFQTLGILPYVLRSVKSRLEKGQVETGKGFVHKESHGITVSHLT